MAEVALHNTSLSCWLAIEGKVYDVRRGMERARAPPPRRAAPCRAHGDHAPRHPLI
jgi:hypothetical protein